MDLGSWVPTQPQQRRKGDAMQQGLALMFVECVDSHRARELGGVSGKKRSAVTGLL